MTNINVTTQHQSILLKLIFDYLSGSELSGIHQELSKLCNQTHRHAKTLYQNTRLSLDNKTSLFSILNVPAIKQADYLKETEPLKLLSRLHQDGYGYDHLDYFLKRIEYTKPDAYWKKSIIIGASLTAFLTHLYYSGQTIFSIMYDSMCIIFTQKVVDWVKNTCLLLKNIPILGIIYQSGALLWQLYSTFRYGFENIRQKMTTSLFGVLSKGSAITGYSISLFAAGIATPAAGILFTLSGLI
ncbi:MAG: hypothetical protein B7X00_01705, partial [Legionella sp. 21-45-4]